MNPYLSMAALLWGGLEGIRSGLEPPPYAVGDPIETGAYARLPKTLAATTSAFRSSAEARTLLGDTFVDHVSIVRDEEAAEFAAWCEANAVDPDMAGPVTQWEYQQYFTWA